MICNYPRLCRGLEPFILGPWTPDIEQTGLYSYVVGNTRTGESATYGVVLAQPGERPVWINLCPTCGTSLASWIESGRHANGTSADTSPE